MACVCSDKVCSDLFSLGNYFPVIPKANCGLVKKKVESVVNYYVQLDTFSLLGEISKLGPALSTTLNVAWSIWKGHGLRFPAKTVCPRLISR